MVTLVVQWLAYRNPAMPFSHLRIHSIKLSKSNVYLRLTLRKQNLSQNSAPRMKKLLLGNGIFCKWNALKSTFAASLSLPLHG